MSTTPTANPELVQLTIDGKPVSVPKGTNILEAAKTVGVDISYFCYHPGLSSPAVCRQCLVEVKGLPKPVPSCYTPVAPNMEVLASSPRSLQVRQQMLEFTLVNHPVDCPICDKAGECHLQKNFMEHDQHASRVDIDKRAKPKIVDLGPTIVLDAERCILCTRCIRVCDEVAKDHQLEMAHRGDREQLTTAPGKVLDNPYSLNTVDVCPVGALTSKDFRFTMRAWQLHMVPSVCTGCATGCNTEIHFSQGRVYRLVPRENQAVNKHWMCDEGRYTYHELTGARVAGASVGGEIQSLDKTIAHVAERIAALATAGASELCGIVVNAQATNEDNYALVKAAELLGWNRFYLAGRPARPERADDILRHADVNPNTAGARAVTRGKAKLASQLAADLQSGALKALWILGDHVELDDAALAAVQRLELCVFQTPRRGPLSERAGVVLPAAAWAEEDGTVTTAKGVVQRLRYAIEPPGEARPHHELIALVLRKLGHMLYAGTAPGAAGRPAALPGGAAAAKQLFHEMVQVVPEFAGAQFGVEVRPIQLRFAASRG